MSSIDFEIPIGSVCVDEFLVKEEHAARHIGSGEASVLSTPSMIAFIEKTSASCIHKHLPQEYTTVGTLVNVRHLKPAPIGSTIKVEAKIAARDGRRITCEVKAYFGDILIGEGIHERFIVHRGRFAERAKKVSDTQNK
ncbi:MAG: thioesterase family protein [Desulfurococcaceae archaeon]